MLNSFIIILREGFESFLIVAVILAYLRKARLKWLSSAVYCAILLALSASLGLGYTLKYGVSDSTLETMLGAKLGLYASQFLANESLREGVLGIVAIIMVGTLVVHMWRTGPNLRGKMHQRLSKLSSGASKLVALAGVFLFTFVLITREGMETALLLLQVHDPQLVSGAVLGLSAAGALAWGWARFGHLIDVKRFFQVTGLFLLLFMIQVAIYSFHEFSEAGLLPNSEVLHAATEKLSPDGLYGKWFSVVMVAVCGFWLVGAWLIDRVQESHTPTFSAPEGSH